MMFGKLLTTAGLAALLIAAPAAAQETQDQGMGSQDSQILKKKKAQPEGQATGGQQIEQNQATGDQGQTTNRKLKKSQEAAGEQPMTEDQQAAGEEAQPTKKKKKDLQQSTETEEMTGEGQTKKKKLKQSQEATGEEGDATKKKVEQTEQSKESVTTGTTGKIATEIPADKKTVVREKLVTKNVTRVERDKLNIDINVGVAVPRTIELHTLPVEVVEIVPAYRGYFYFVLVDGTIVIVEPDTLQIVYVLTA